MIFRSGAGLRAAGPIPLAILFCAVTLTAFGGSAPASPGSAPAVSNQPPAVELKLADYVRMVLERNESLQAQMLDAEASHRRAKAETGLFEPGLALSAHHEENRRQNTVEQQQALGIGQAQIFEEKNNIYNAWLEGTAPTGAKIRLGSSLTDLRNSLNDFFATPPATNGTHQYQSFVGATLTQPLLKNAGTSVTLAGIRLAALDSDIAFQEYRRQMMLIVSQAEASYWNLYFAQEQMRFFDESVSVAQSILSDNQERLKGGQASELDVLEAQAGLALRKTKQNDARQNYLDALGRLRVLYNAIPADQVRVVRAIDRPSAAAVAMSYSNSFQQAFELNPDYLIQRRKVDQERLRYNAARNQVLPELDLKAAYGYNGLGNTPADAWENVGGQDFPSWSVGLELNLPLSGNIKGRNLYQASKLSLQSAILNLNNIQTQVANLLNTSMQKANSWHDSIQSYQTVVQFNEDLLKTQLERLNVGRVEPRKVLEVEADLFDARQSLAQALVFYQRSLLELQLAGGTVLQTRRLDLTREQLRKKTFALLQEQTPALNPFEPVFDPRPRAVK